MEDVIADFGASINIDSNEPKPVNSMKILKSAFVFINVEPDSYDLALEDLRRIEGVNEVYLSRGAYDLVAKISGESLDYLREAVLKQIKNLTSIKSTLTLTLIDSPKR